MHSDKNMFHTTFSNIYIPHNSLNLTISWDMYICKRLETGHTSAMHPLSFSLTGPRRQTFHPSLCQPFVTWNYVTLRQFNMYIIYSMVLYYRQWFKSCVSLICHFYKNKFNKAIIDLEYIHMCDLRYLVRNVNLTWPNFFSSNFTIIKLPSH